MPDDQPAPATLAARLVPIALVAGVLASRAEALPAAPILLGLAAALALWAGLAAPAQARAVLPLTALIATLTAATRLAGDDLWPCPVSCAGGGAYQRLWGIPVHIPAVLMMAAVAALAWQGLRRGRELGATALAWLAVGGSLFFLWTAWRLDLACHYCFAVHAGVAATALFALRGAAPWWMRPAALATGAGALLLAFGPTLLVDGPAAPAPDAPPPVTAPALATPGGQTIGPATPEPTSRFDAARRWGSPQSAYLLEVAVDPHCAHCAETLAPLMSSLQRAIDSGRVEVAWRFLVRPSAPTGRELAAHMLASGDHDQLRLLASLLVGTPEGRGWETVRARVAELTDADALHAARERDRAAIDALLDEDAAVLGQRRIRTTPSAIMLRRTGDEMLRWEGKAFDPAAPAREIPFD
jgi:hypothetical protein